MTQFAIRAEGLGKKYFIGSKRTERYRTFREAIMRRLKGGRPGTEEDFWALRNVDFEIAHGEVVGVIGRNGAGKSTLLKILSRITEPTEGRVAIHGRVGSLLEVGTGFHPELTGRENVYLNGAILGMRRAEIRSKFDEIVAFAEVEKFLDTPVKHYSTGMHVRLAFAVAAHLEPELLVVDEVLAVGDADFQKRCLGKMEDVSRKEGRTVLFVSHNMAVIQSLCPRAMLLDAGRIRFFGPTAEAIPQYLATAAVIASFERPVRDGNTTITDGHIRMEGDTLILEAGIASAQARACTLEIKLHDGLGIPIGFASAGLLDPDKQLQLQEGRNRFSCRLHVPSLAIGHYFVSLQLGIPWVDVIDRAERVMRFDVDRPASPGKQHVLRQEWGFGCFEIPLEVAPITTHKAT